jgi:hypothetical protein
MTHLTTHCIYTPWVLTNKLHELQGYNSLYIWCNSLMQFYQNNFVFTTMQLHYNYTHNIMLMSLIVIHPLKYDKWHFEKIWT